MVKRPEVPRGGKRVNPGLKGRMLQPADRTESILDDDHDHVRSCRQDRAVIVPGGPKVVGAPVDPNINWQSPVVLRPVYIDIQTILAAGWIHYPGANPLLSRIKLRTDGGW